MWEILLLDFFAVGDSDAGLSSHWTNELHSHRYSEELSLRNESILGVNRVKRLVRQ